MAKIDLEKVLITLLDSPFNKQFDEKVKDALKEQGLEYKDGKIVEIQKPKFKVGDWVINRTDDTIMQIINNTDFYETIEISGQRGIHTYNYVEWNFRLWSIEDAKDGDILQLGEVTAIFKEYIGNGYCKCYCSICEGEFEILIEEAGDNIFGCINTTPATQEERKLLFQKMKEAGYDWNVAKKKLEKIHKPLYEVGNIIGYKSHYYYIKEVVKSKERGFHYNLIAVDGGEVISIGPAGEKDIILISNNRFDYEHANIQQKDYAHEEDVKPFDKYKGLTDFERTLADVCIGWIGEEHGWKQYIKDNADVLLKIAIEKFNKDFDPVDDKELFFGDFRKIDSEDKGKASFANRQLYNRAILKILSDYVEKYPDIRFGQMLCNLDVNPHFDEESRESYWNLSKTINKQNHE